jgi:ArsR family transcriptional regulator
MTVPDPKTAEALARSLKLLANPNRLRILTHLSKGEASVGSIETDLDIRQPNLSRELANLRDAGAIVARRESKVVFYSLEAGEVVDMLRRVLGETTATAVRPTAMRPATRLDFDPRPKFRFSPNNRVSPSAGH